MLFMATTKHLKRVACERKASRVDKITIRTFFALRALRSPVKLSCIRVPRTSPTGAHDNARNTNRHRRHRWQRESYTSEAARTFVASSGIHSLCHTIPPVRIVVRHDGGEISEWRTGTIGSGGP